MAEALASSSWASWRPEDSILAVYAMFIELQDEDGSHESELGILHDTLPREMFELLAPPGTEWDAPIAGEPFAAPPIPGPEVFDLRWPGAPRRSTCSTRGSRAGTSSSCPRWTRRWTSSRSAASSPAVPGASGTRFPSGTP